MRKRIFVAIDISDEAKRKISDYIETLRREFSNLRVGWGKAEKLHLTLKFLGDTDEKQLGKIIEAVEKATRKISNFKLQISETKFKLQISNTGVFPSPRNARVLWIDVKDEKGILSELSKILENECEKIGLAKEKRGFKPHLTIARLREPQKSRQLAEKHLQNKFEPVEFEVSEIVIYQSKLQPTGSVYQKVQSFKFQVPS